jgi:hypothetical protein
MPTDRGQFSEGRSKEDAGRRMLDGKFGHHGRARLSP